MEGIASLIFADLVTIPLTALICRHRIRCHKPISYGTMLGCAFLAVVLFVVSVAVYFNGWEVFLIINGWLHGKIFDPGTVFTILSCVTIACIVPTLAVVVYYHRPHKKEAIPVAFTLEDGAAIHRKSSGTFEIPSQECRKSLKPGDLAKLIFRIKYDDETHAERMWVRVEEVRPEFYVGVLDHNSFCTDQIRSGMRVEFHSDHVIQIDHLA